MPAALPELRLEADGTVATGEAVDNIKPLWQKTSVTPTRTGSTTSTGKRPAAPTQPSNSGSPSETLEERFKRRLAGEEKLAERAKRMYLESGAKFVP